MPWGGSYNPHVQAPSWVKPRKRIWKNIVAEEDEVVWVELIDQRGFKGVRIIQIGGQSPPEETNEPYNGPGVSIEDCSKRYVKAAGY